MASSIVNNTIQGETFLPGQIFVFGGFTLWANSLGPLEQIDSYAPGHQIRFGNLNYTADIHEDLIFDGFGPVPGAPDSHDECWCQNRRISGRGSRSVRLRLMVTRSKGHNVYPGSGPLDGGKTLLPA